MPSLDKTYFSTIHRWVNSPIYQKVKTTDVTPYCFSTETLQDTTQLKFLLKKHGFILTSLQPENLDIWLTRYLGTPWTIKNSDSSTFMKVRAEKFARFYVNSSAAQAMHTDEGYTTLYPRYVALYCVQPASHQGGVSIIVPFQPLYDYLNHFFSNQLNSLFEAHAVHIQTHQGSLKKPVFLQLSNTDYGISYSPVLRSLSADNTVLKLFKTISTYVHNPRHQLRFQLKPHDLLLLDNARALHGRTAFLESEPRLLYRYWF